MRVIVTAIVSFKQRTVCIINVWGCAEILPSFSFQLSGPSDINFTLNNSNSPMTRPFSDFLGRFELSGVNCVLYSVVCSRRVYLLTFLFIYFFIDEQHINLQK